MSNHHNFLKDFKAFNCDFCCLTSSSGLMSGYGVTVLAFKKQSTVNIGDSSERRVSLAVAIFLVAFNDTWWQFTLH